jgi:hypothetical protein
MAHVERLAQAAQKRLGAVGTWHSGGSELCGDFKLTPQHAIEMGKRRG